MATGLPLAVFLFAFAVGTSGPQEHDRARAQTFCSAAYLSAHVWSDFEPKVSAAACKFLQPSMQFQGKGVKGDALGSSATASETTRQVIPFKLIDGRILVLVRINDDGPFTFIFDSGASAALSPELAQRLGLPLSGTQSDSGTGAAAIETSTTTLSQVALGSLILRDQTVVVTSMRDMPPVFGKQQIDGIIGRPVLSKSVVEVDYDKSELILINPRDFVPSPDDQVIPFTRIREVPLVHATLDGHAGTFGVDLGARSSLLVTGAFAEQYDLAKSLRSSSEMITGWGLGGPIHSRLARAHSLTLAHFTIENPLVRLSTQRAGLLTKSDISGLIGADILRQFCITFDDSRHRILVRKSKSFGQPTDFDKSGMWLVQDGPAFSVLEVVPDTAAARAGVEQGDRLIAIDGTKTADILLPAIRERWAKANEATPVHLLVERAGNRQEFTINLQAIR